MVGEEPTAFTKPLSPSMLPTSSLIPSSSPLPRSPNSSFSVLSGAVISTEVVKGSAHKVSWNEDLNLCVNLSACFVVASGNKTQSESINDSLTVPIVHLTQLLGYCFLDSKDQSPVRVSVRSLALSCLMYSVSLYPGALLCGGLPVGEGGRCYGQIPEGSRCVCVRVCVHLCVCVCVCVCVCTCFFVKKYLRMYVCMYIASIIRLYTCTYVYRFTKVFNLLLCTNSNGTPHDL